QEVTARRGVPEKVELWTKEMDYYGLACHIFRLLFCGLRLFLLPNNDGFAGHNPADKEFTLTDDAHIQQHSPLQIDDLPDEIILKLLYAIDPKGNPDDRTTAEAWQDALKRLSLGLHECNRNKMHFFARTDRGCPWCRYEEKTGVDWFAPAN
ncbi:MAG: hypothetical protein ACP5QA_15655, partial [Phycisphaerae bacterium]